MITPTIQHIDEKILIGMDIITSLVDNKTFELFSKFMPRREEIDHISSPDVYDIRVYSPEYYLKFNPTASFTKWAAVEVSTDPIISDEMKLIHIPSGLYAIFSLTGLGPHQAIFEYIFTDWLPNSEYTLDDRPHFDRLTESYQRREIDALQEICIPVLSR